MSIGAWLWRGRAVGICTRGVFQRHDVYVLSAGVEQSAGFNRECQFRCPAAIIPGLAAVEANRKLRCGLGWCLRADGGEIAAGTIGD